VCFPSNFWCMKNLHQKLECSHRLWVKFGGRRRKCKSCGQTWRTYPHKRGRDQKRPIQLFEKYVSGGLPSLFQYAKQKKVSVRTVSFRLEKQRDIFCRKTAWSKIPAGPLIIIADAFIHQIQHEWFTSYLILIRSIDEDRAVILPPYFASGREGILNWYKALDEVPLEVRKRVKALVSDGHRGDRHLCQKLWLGDATMHLSLNFGHARTTLQAKIQRSPWRRRIDLPANAINSRRDRSD